MKAVETEVWTVIRLIQSKSIEKVASILKNRNYRVYRDTHIDITAYKDIGKSGLRIEINLRKEEISAISTDLKIYTATLFRNYSLETEFWTVYPLIENKSVEEVVSILENLNYHVYNETYADIWHGPRHRICTIISAIKSVGKSNLFIDINTRLKELWAYGGGKRFWSVTLPFYDYGKEELLKDIRKSVLNQKWRRTCLKRDFGRCQNCGIDIEKAYSLGDKLDVHHIKSLIRIVEENNIKTWADAEKCYVLWDLDNGLTLCGYCHRKLTKLQKLTLRWEKILPLSSIVKSKT